MSGADAARVKAGDVAKQDLKGGREAALAEHVSHDVVMRFIVCRASQDHVLADKKAPAEAGGYRLSIVFLVVGAFISVSSDEDVRHPVRRSAHYVCDAFH